jgi:prevent-host-death family protein
VDSGGKRPHSIEQRWPVAQRLDDIGSLAHVRARCRRRSVQREDCLLTTADEGGRRRTKPLRRSAARRSTFACRDVDWRYYVTNYMTSRSNAMTTVTLADAKTHLSRLLDQVEAGEEVIITRRGQAVARISSVEKPKQPIKSLAEFRSHMPHWRKSSAELLREMRDESL